MKAPVLYGENYLSIASGNGQYGVKEKPLPKPLVAKVTNTFGYPLQGYRVKFESIAGGGKLSRPEATTDSNGEASVGLTLSNIHYGHIVQATAEEKNDTPHKGKALKDSPIQFDAFIWDEEIADTFWTFELKSSQGKSNSTITCQLKENGVAQIGGQSGTYSLSNNSLTINWVSSHARPPGCTYQLKGTVNGTSCSGTYTHWDYDEKGARFVWDSGTFTGYLVSLRNPLNSLPLCI